MTMNGELDTTYFDYLESQIGMRRNSGSYRDLLNILFAKDFVWLVPNDDNRIADGLDIRAEWFDTIVVIGEDRCSFLEVHYSGWPEPFKIPAGQEISLTVETEVFPSVIDPVQKTIPLIGY